MKKIKVTRWHNGGEPEVTEHEVSGEKLAEIREFFSKFRSAANRTREKVMARWNKK